jgi:RNA polymerase sigma factor (sigma-70 family)
LPGSGSGLAVRRRFALRQSQRRTEVEMQPQAVHHPKAERVRVLAAELFSKHRPRLLNIARANAGGPVDPEEAIQQAFCAFLAHYDPDSKAPPLAWLALTLKRECWARYEREHLERRAGQEASPDCEDPGTSIPNLVSPAPGPDHLAEHRERVAETRRRLARLKPAERRAISLKALGYSYREIGEITGFSHTKTNRCLAEGRAALRAMAEV